MKKLLKQNGGSFIETAIIVPVIAVLILVILQFTIIITCHLAVNFAAYKAARAVLLSSNKSEQYGYGNANSVVKDAKKTARGTLSIFYPYVGLGWMTPPSVKLYRHSGRMRSGISEKEITESGMAQPPNQTIWVVVRSRAIISIPLMKPVIGKLFGIMRLTDLKATCLVDTPSQP